MSFKINYSRDIHDKNTYPKREELSLLYIDKNNIWDNLSYVSKTIQKFNEEISWDDMWTVENADTRTNINHRLFILLENNEPIGHVWFDGGLLYNAFVSKERQDGDSVWFIEESITKLSGYIGTKQITLCVDDWNKRAIRFWEKLNFIKENNGYTKY